MSCNNLTEIELINEVVYHEKCLKKKGQNLGFFKWDFFPVPTLLFLHTVSTLGARDAVQAQFRGGHREGERLHTELHLQLRAR